MGCNESANQNVKDRSRDKLIQNVEDEKEDLDFDFHVQKGQVDILKPLQRKSIKSMKRKSKILEYDNSPNKKKASEIIPDFVNMDNGLLHTAWLENEGKIYSKIKDLNSYNVIKQRVKSLHELITYFTLDNENITSSFKITFQEYIDSVWNKNRDKFEQNYYKLDEMITISSFQGTKSIEDIVKVFEESREEILNSLIDSLNMGESPFDLEKFHSTIVLYLEKSYFENYFLEVKKCLIAYKRYASASEKNSSNIRRLINKIKLLFAMFEVTQTKSFKALNKLFDEDQTILIENCMGIEDPPATKNDILKFNERIKKILISDSPYYLETRETLIYYYKSAYYQDRCMFLAAIEQFGLIFPDLDDVLNGRIKIDFSHIESIDNFITTWKQQEKAFMHLQSQVTNLHRREIGSLHNYMLYTFELETFNVPKIKNQLVKYHLTVLSRNLNDIKEEMNNLMILLKEANYSEDQKVPNGRPIFLDVKNSSLRDAWMNFTIEPYCKRILYLDECPMNRINIKLLSGFLKRKLKNSVFEFPKLKILMQNFSNSLWDKNFTSLQDDYDDIIVFLTTKNIIV